MSGTRVLCPVRRGRVPRMTPQEELTARLRALLAGEPSVREVRMIGGRSFLVNGKLVAGARKDGSLLVRVHGSRQEELASHPGARPAQMGAGRMMGPGWMEVSAAAAADPDVLSFWLGAALEFNHATHNRTGKDRRGEEEA